MTATLCLCMIVKDEAAIIERCLRSVRPLLSTWVIVDTGSSDGTQDVIRRFFTDLPGELHERPWKSFGDNRTEAMQLARGTADYTLIMDADDELSIPPGWQLPSGGSGRRACVCSCAYRPVLHSESTDVTTHVSRARFS